MKESPCRCMDCRRWFVASGQIVRAPAPGGLVSDGLCPDCFIERTAPLRPHSLAAWVTDARVSPQQILEGLAA